VGSKTHPIKGIPPVEPHKLAMRGIPILNLLEAAGKELKTPKQ